MKLSWYVILSTFSVPFGASVIVIVKSRSSLLANQQTQQNEGEKIDIRGSQAPCLTAAVSNTSSSHSNGKSEKDRFHCMPKLLCRPAHFGSLT
jgi:hypothetical protein